MQYTVSIMNHIEMYVHVLILKVLLLNELLDLRIRLQMEVKDQNMVKHPLGIHHMKYTTQRNSSWDLHTVSKSYRKFPKDA